MDSTLWINSKLVVGLLLTGTFVSLIQQREASTSAPQSCYNGGTASYNESTLECLCPKYTTGSYCEDINCTLFECYNNGTVVNTDGFCMCTCTSNFTGILCETELLPSDWPDGPYALLMPTSGCPESSNHGWRAGFIHFTTTGEIEIWREFNYSNDHVNRTRLAKSTPALVGPFKNYSFRLNFCYKSMNSSVKITAMWPGVNVTVFGDNEGCPYGLNEEINYMPLPQLESWWHDGYLPHFEMHTNGNESLLETIHCHLKDARLGDTRLVKHNKAFVIAKAYGSSCPSVMEGFDIEEENLQFISVNNHDIGQTLQTNISVCMYKPQQVDDLYPSNWPNGPYALPMPNTGCPEPLNHGWRVGYIQLERRFGYQGSPDHDECRSFEMFGLVLELYHPTDSQLFFCFKYGQQNKDAIQWPQGNYSIFGADTGCPEVCKVRCIPSGSCDQRSEIFTDSLSDRLTPTTLTSFQEKNHTLETYAQSVLSTKEPLPYYVVDEMNTKLTFKYCEKSDGMAEFSPRWKKPFALLKSTDNSCNDNVAGFKLQTGRWIEMDGCIFIPIEGEQNVCDNKDFRCFDGRCIRFAHRCDHDKDCAFGEDEENCTYSCNQGESCFQTPVPFGGAQNCTQYDKAPEYRCEQECYDYEIKCGSGECVKKIHVCDKIKDCQDGSDERFDNCGLRCARNAFLCPEKLTCLSNRWICDKYVDCIDEVDELDSICPLVCKSGELYMGKSFRWDQKRPVCMTAHEEMEPGTALGLNSTTSCNRALGLTDGSITDLQLIASSYKEGHQPYMSRSYKSSWCPLENDTIPYLEVSLNYVTVIGGITVYNSVVLGGKTVNNEYIPVATPVGIGSFSIQYAWFENGFRQYSNEAFEIDKSKKVSEPQTFTFLQPFLARYVRIYPRDKLQNRSLCLRVELLGCSQTGTDNRRISLSKLEEFNLLISGPYELANMIRSSDKIYRWNITVPDGGYIKLSFLSIDLYNQSDVQTERCPYDVITFNALFEPISAKHNSETPIYPTDQTSLLMTFVSCLREKQGKSSFSVLIDKEEIPTIWGEIKDSNITEGKISTLSLLGSFVNLPESQIWNLDSSVHGRPFVLRFQRFNIPCKTKYDMVIKNAHGTASSFCNSGMRPKPIYKAWRLHIKFEYGESVSRHDPEGFSAIFQIEPVSKHPEWFHVNEGYEAPIDVGQFGVYTVHSNTLKKYYRLSYLNAYVDWFTQAKYCERFNSSLAVLHSRAELDFLQSWLFQRTSHIFTTKSERSSAFLLSSKLKKWLQTTMYIHIGLFRYEGMDGLKEIWQDGTSLSFTAWDIGEPKYISDNRCTGMQVNMTTEKGSWVTRKCNEKLIMKPDFIFASLCEKPSVPNEPADNQRYKRYAGFHSHVHRLQDVRLFHCNSTEWVSHLALCDGIPDCYDGSDEKNCHRNSVDICSEDMFKCTNGECIPIGKVCDYIEDCGDKSDENCYKYPCKDEEYKCDNRQCIPNYLQCNAVKDCIDGSDEVQCRTCQDSFLCFMDLTCIDKSLKCDNIRNCADGTDEIDCDSNYTTCFDLWKAGFDRDVSIDERDKYIECQFNATDDQLNVTTFFDVKTEWEIIDFDPGVYSLTSYSNQFIKRKLSDFRGMDDPCYIQVTVNCPEYNWLANCKLEEYGISFVNQSWIAPRVTTSLYVDIRMINDYVRIRRSLEKLNRHVNVHPAECIAEPRDIGQQLRCGDGEMVSSSIKCLYNINRVGVIDGCRNYKHLDDCEHFTCPPSYFKCPSSFCLAQRHLCDAERQCPGGEDEHNCWCDGNRSSIVVIYNEEFREAVPFIHQFARQFYSRKTDIFSVRYSFNLRNRSFTVYKSPIHPYTEGLYFGEVESFTTNYLYEDISSSFNTGKEIDIINIEQNRWLKRKGTFSNLTFINHVYHVSVDPNLRQRANVTPSERESVLKIKKWKILASVGSALFPSVCKAKPMSTCEDQFRCLSSKVCIPDDQVCDGTPHCPLGDDEIMCDFHCHKKCSCQSYNIDCQSTNFTQGNFFELDQTLRVIDLSENEMFKNYELSIPKRFPYLIKLCAKKCGIISVKEKTFQYARNIRHLDLSFNKLQSITTKTFEGLRKLEILNLKGNYYIESIQPKSFKMLSSLIALTITNARISEIQADTFWGLNVSILNISHNGIHKINALSFNELSTEELDFSGNDVDDFDPDIFTGIDRMQLKTIRSPAYKFCCVKPSSLSDNSCWPHQDVFSSCEDLMRNRILQTLVWVLGAVAMIANGCTVFYRLVYDRKCLKKGFGMFVTNLAASDFLMGVYMIIIAVADITFRDRYIMVDEYWRNSAWCDLAGVLATVSSEASVLFMCLITVDRILVIKYPFGQLKFNPKSSKVAMIVSWAISWTIALVPILVHDYFEGKFYSTSGVCLALPLTHLRPAGWLYSFLIYVALNFMAFIMIAIGQLVIYLEIRATSKRVQKVKSQRRNDIRIAKNLLLVLSTDFLCWFPVGVMAMMAASGYVIPGETYAWTAVLIVPVNASMNPFLYTLSAVLQKATSTIATETKDKTIISKDFKVQCNIDANAVKEPDTSKDFVNQPLDQVPPEQITITPKEVLSAYIASARNMACIHDNNYVYGSFNIADVLYNTKGRKIRMYHPDPLPSGSECDKRKDVYDVGLVIKYMLKFTKSYKQLDSKEVKS